MKLSNTFKSALAGAMIMGTQPGCANDTPECSIIANQSDSKTLYSKTEVLSHCSNPNNLVALSRQNILTCVEGFNEEGDGINSKEVTCQDTNLNTSLDEVYSHEGAYCMSTGAKIDCSEGADNNVPQPPPTKIECDILANSSNAVILNSQSSTETHCSNTGNNYEQKILTCIEAFSPNGETLLYAPLNCADGNLKTELAEVFSYPDAYCVSTGAAIDCKKID